MKRHKKRIVLAALLVALAGVSVPWVATAFVARAAPPVFRRIEDVPTRPIAIVFGAGVTPSGVPTAALADRVGAAVELFHAGRVKHLLMTGDNSSTHYDEVSVMRRFAEGQGVPAEAITLDYAGFRTYDSCYRAHAIFGVTEAVLVTQAYHLPRALYTCQHFGLNVVGLAADALPNSRRALYQYLLPGYIARERLATLVMLWQVHITHPLPRFLGPREPIEG